MCGFAAEIRLDDQSADVQALNRMSDILAP